MTVLVNIASNYPLHCKPGLGRLCIVPFTRQDESCLVRSGLVSLLDTLCGMHEANAEDLDVERQGERHKMSQMAWAVFKVRSRNNVRKGGLIAE